MVRSILVTAYYNTTDMTSARSGLPCENGSLPPGIELDIGDLALDDRESFACALIEQDGSISVTVAALGEELYEHTPPEPRIPRVEYHASLFTSPDHLSDDYPLFREFLERIELLPLE